MKTLGINETNEVYKSKVYNTCTVNFFYVRTEKIPSYYLSHFIIQQPASIVFNYRIQCNYTHTLPTPSLLNFY